MLLNSTKICCYGGRFSLNVSANDMNEITLGRRQAQDDLECLDDEDLEKFLRKCHDTLAGLLSILTPLRSRGQTR